MTWEDELRAAKSKRSAREYANLLGVPKPTLENWLCKGVNPHDATKVELRRRMAENREVVKPEEKK